MRKHILNGLLGTLLSAALVLSMMPSVTVQAQTPVKESTEEAVSTTEENMDAVADPDREVTLRISNWEEYIDLGDWDEEEVIDLESGDIFGENSLVHDFEDWYYETYGVKVKVEYSTFGTNEDLYNMLTLGDTFDLVCPSEYLFMKLMAEKKLEPLSKGFFDENTEENYYTKGVSPYIKNIFDTKEIQGENWGKYAAGYMWGITGIVYNPEVVSTEDALTWNILKNPKYKRQVTIKDNVRDSYFAAVGAIKSDLLTSKEFINNPDYSQNLEDEMNDVSPETMAKAEAFLQSVKDNTYSFESDAGKADMITGKVVANYQWSGDAVYTMDQADEDDYTLDFAVPEESTNIYFDGWVMLKDGIDGDPARKHAAEAFINFVSRPDNVVRNMYYIGYTSVISGGDDSRIFEYADWNFSAEDDEEETVDYPIGWFFDKNGNNENEDYIITAPAEQMKRQLFAQYPSQEAISHASIMIYFDNKVNEAINEMWIHVRCYNINKLPMWGIVLILAVVVASVVMLLRMRRKHKDA